MGRGKQDVDSGDLWLLKDDIRPPHIVYSRPVQTLPNLGDFLLYIWILLLSVW